MRESAFERQTIGRIKDLFPGAIVIKLDPQLIQGIPDRLVLFRNRWAALEFKRSTTASKRPNQSHHVTRMNEMSYASFVNPDNVEDVLRDLQRAFGTARKARVPKS